MFSFLFWSIFPLSFCVLELLIWFLADTDDSVKSSSGSEGGRKISPRSVSLETRQKSTGRVVRQLKTTGLEANSSTSIRTPKTTSNKTLDRTSPRGLDPEVY